MEHRQYPEIYRTIKSLCLVEMDTIDPLIAEQMAEKITEAIRKNFAGGMVYFPKGDWYELTERDQKIWAEFNGKNHQQLIQKYNISLQWLYKIIKTARKLDKSQHDLFC